jgi:hypothetical protein
MTVTMRTIVTLAFIANCVNAASPAKTSKCTEADKSMWIGKTEFTWEYLNVAVQSGGTNALAEALFKKKYPSMSTSCIQCHSSVIACGAESCLVDCMDPTSLECGNCIDANCIPAYKTCLGVTSETHMPIPPQKLL